MQSFHSLAPPEGHFEPREKTFSFCMQKTQEAPASKRFKIRHTYRVFGCETPTRCNLVRRITLNGETLTSMDHYAEGPGEFTWWTIWRMSARTAHNQTTERDFMITQQLLLPISTAG